MVVVQLPKVRFYFVIYSKIPGFFFILSILVKSILHKFQCVPFATAALPINTLQYTLFEPFVHKTKAAGLQTDQMTLMMKRPTERSTV